jgi:hypothetical protein
MSMSRFARDDRGEGVVSAAIAGALDAGRSDTAVRGFCEGIHEVMG